MAGYKAAQDAGQPPADNKTPFRVTTSSSTDSLVPEEKNAANPFLDPKVAHYYRGLYEDAKYECRHAFDPELEWTAEEEEGRQEDGLARVHLGMHHVLR